MKVNRELNITEFEGFSEEEVKESLSPKDITVEMVKIQPNVTASTSAGSKVDETPMETDIEETSPKKTMSDETFVESTAVRLPVSPPTYISTLYIKLKTPEKSPEALIVVHHSIVINLANTSEFKSEKGEKANDVAIVEQMGEVGVVDESGAIEDGGAVGEPGRMEVNGAIEEVVNNSPSDDELMAVMPMADIDMVAETQPQEWGVQSQKSSEGINLDADMLGLTGSEFWSPVGEIPREHEEIIHPIEQPQDRPLSAYPEELEEVNNVNHSHCSPNKTRSPENFQTTQQTEDDSYLAWMNLSQIPETQQPTTSSSQIENAPQEEQLSPEISFTSAQQTGQPSNQLTKEAKANEPSDLVINCSGLSVEEKLNVMNFALRIREVKFCSGDVDSSTTHLVVKAISTPEGYRCVNRTLKYMKAMARRLWVVSYDWIVKSFEQQKPLSPVHSFFYSSKVVDDSRLFSGRV